MPAPQVQDASSPKDAHSHLPPLSFWQIWNMSFGFFGIQFGWGLQMANMSAIYQFLGAGEEDIAILWLAAPLTGLIIQPIVGFYSDRTWTRLGRRRPYFLVGALFASLALVAMPNSSTLWMAAGLLWILDASVNISMEPFRAFVGDLLPPKQRKAGFAMQSVLIGAGAVLASAMPWVLTNLVGISSGSPDVILSANNGIERAIDLDTAIPLAVHISFYMGAALFLAAVLYTVITTKEHPPADPEAFAKMKAESAGVSSVFKEIIHGVTSMPHAMRRLAVVQFFTWFALFCLWIYFVPGVGTQVYKGQPLGAEIEAPEQTKSNYLSAAKQALVAADVRGDNSEEPIRMSLEAYVGSAMALATSENPGPELTPLESRNPLYTTLADLMLHADGASPTEVSTRLADRLDQSKRYEEGVAWGGLCFTTYNLVAFAFSFVLLGLVQKFSAKRIHTICLMIGAAGFIASGLIREPGLLMVGMVGIGIAWASILSMPYAMLSNVIPGEKMGFYMGVFNFFIVLPQILASLGLGLVVQHLLGNNAAITVALGGISLVVAAFSLRFVNEEN